MRRLLIAIAILVYLQGHSQDESHWFAFTHYDSDGDRSAWFKVDEEKRNRIAMHIMRNLHLKMDGRIECTQNFRIYETGDGEFGQKGDRVFKFVQTKRKDRSKQYWACLVNVDSMKISLLYLASDPSKNKSIYEIDNYNKSEVATP